MFTGIIQNKGKISEWNPKDEGGELVILPEFKFNDIQIGESIAINGCCLTVVKEQDDLLHFDVSDETIRKTTLKNLKKNDQINLERALTLQDRLGGHFVLGHVDEVGLITNILHHDGSVEFQIQFSKDKAALLIEKGSICVDGISLTVCDLKATQFSVYIIPHTLENTHLKNLEKGSAVNLEYDILGKYILRQKEV